MKRAAFATLLLLALFACGLVPVLEGRQTDLEAYRLAAGSLAAHRDPWLRGEPRYLYPPLLAAAFVPLRGLASRPVAVGWAALSALAMALAASRLGQRGVLFALVYAPLYATQWNAQANGFLLLALVLARERLAKDDEDRGGALWGLSVAWKPVALPAAAGFLLARRVRVLAFGAAVAALSLLVVVPFLGWRGVALAARHVARILATSWPEAWPANISLSGTLDRLFRETPHRHAIVGAAVLAVAALASLVKGRRAGAAATLDLFLSATLLGAGASWLHHATVLLPIAVAAPAAGAAATALLGVAAGWRLAAALWPAHGATAAAACGTLALLVLSGAALGRLWRGER